MPVNNGAPVEGGPPPAEYTVLLTFVNTVNPEYVLFLPTELINDQWISRVLQRFVRGEQSQDNDVLTAIMVRGFFAY